jgi:hypothetical protein
MRFRRVPKLFDQIMFVERRLHDPPLNAFPAAMYQPDFSQARSVRGMDVFVDHRRNVARRERVEIDRVFDRELMGHTRTPQPSVPAQ